MKAAVKGHDKLTVNVDCPVDRPQVESVETRPNQAAELAAWNSMRATLDAHESQHRKIGQTWRGDIEKRFQRRRLQRDRQKTKRKRWRTRPPSYRPSNNNGLPTRRRRRMRSIPSVGRS